MALPLTNNAEGGTDGVALSAANSGGASGDAFDVVAAATGSGGSMVYSIDHPADGSLGWKNTDPTVSGFPVEIRWTTSVGTITECYGRIYIYRATLDSGVANRIFMVRSTGSRRAEVTTDGTGKLRAINSANATVATAAAALPLNELVRVEFHYLASATVGRIEIKYFHGHDVASIEDIAIGVNADTGADANEILIAGKGSAVATGYVWYLDAARISTTGWVGPVGANTANIAWLHI